MVCDSLPQAGVPILNIIPGWPRNPVLILGAILYHWMPDHVRQNGRFPDIQSMK